MMALLGSWLTGVTAAAILCALADRLMPEGPVRRAGKLALGLVMLAAVLRPLLQLEAVSPAELWEEGRVQTAARVQELEAERDQTLKAVIEEEFAAYIVDKTARMGGACTVRITCQKGEGGVFLPWAAEIRGTLPGGRREELARLLEEELNIPRDRQDVQTEEGAP